MRLGEFELHSLSDGFFGLDGGAMWAQAPAGASGVVPKLPSSTPSDLDRVLMLTQC